MTCIVEQSVQDESSAMMALIENLQREDLHYLEEAQCYSTLLSTYNLTQEELAQRLGKSQSSIANKLRLCAAGGGKDRHGGRAPDGTPCARAFEAPG